MPGLDAVITCGPGLREQPALGRHTYPDSSALLLPEAEPCRFEVAVLVIIKRAATCRLSAFLTESITNDPAGTSG